MSKVKIVENKDSSVTNAIVTSSKLISQTSLGDTYLSDQDFLQDNNPEKSVKHDAKIIDNLEKESEKQLSFQFPLFSSARNNLEYLQSTKNSSEVSVKYLVSNGSNNYYIIFDNEQTAKKFLKKYNKITKNLVLLDQFKNITGSYALILEDLDIDLIRSHDQSIELGEENFVDNNSTDSFIDSIDSNTNGFNSVEFGTGVQIDAKLVANDQKNSTLVSGISKENCNKNDADNHARCLKESQEYSKYLEDLFLSAKEFSKSKHDASEEQKKVEESQVKTVKGLNLVDVIDKGMGWDGCVVQDEEDFSGIVSDQADKICPDNIYRGIGVKMSIVNSYVVKKGKESINIAEKGLEIIKVFSPEVKRFMSFGKNAKKFKKYENLTKGKIIIAILIDEEWVTVDDIYNNNDFEEDAMHEIASYFHQDKNVYFETSDGAQYKCANDDDNLAIFLPKTNSDGEWLCISDKKVNAKKAIKEAVVKSKLSKLSNH